MLEWSKTLFSPHLPEYLRCIPMSHTTQGLAIFASNPLPQKGHAALHVHPQWTKPGSIGRGAVGESMRRSRHLLSGSQAPLYVL